MTRRSSASRALPLHPQRCEVSRHIFLPTSLPLPTLHGVQFPIARWLWLALPSRLLTRRHTTIWPERHLVLYLRDCGAPLLAAICLLIEPLERTHQGMRCLWPLRPLLRLCAESFGKYNGRVCQVGEWRLGQSDGSSANCGIRYDAVRRSNERRSLGTALLEVAKEKLIKLHANRQRRGT